MRVTNPNSIYYQRLENDTDANWIPSVEQHSYLTFLFYDTLIFPVQNCSLCSYVDKRQT